MTKTAKYFRSDDSVWRVKLVQDLSQTAADLHFVEEWLTDTHTMTAMISSHKSQILEFSSKEAAMAAYHDYVRFQLTQESLWSLGKSKSALSADSLRPSSDFKSELSRSQSPSRQFPIIWDTVSFDQEGYLMDQIVKAWDDIAAEGYFARSSKSNIFKRFVKKLTGEK